MRLNVLRWMWLVDGWTHGYRLSRSTGVVARGHAHVAHVTHYHLRFFSQIPHTRAYMGEIHIHTRAASAHTRTHARVCTYTASPCHPPNTKVHGVHAQAA